MRKNDWELFFIFAGIMVIAIFSFGFGCDYFWHVKAGEYIVTNLKIPYHDVFSWYGISRNLYWISHEWLSEIVLFGYKYLFKGLGPILFNISIYLLLVSVLFAFNKEHFKKNKVFTFIWALVGTIVFSRVMLPRPHMISYVLLTFAVYVLFDNFKNKDSKKIYFLPLISMLWANFHGGSSNLPYVLCFIFLIVGLFKFKFGKIEAERISRKQIKKYLICGILSIVAIVINPHWFKMITYPYINMGDSLMISSIVEWASPSLNNIKDYGDFALLGIIILSMIVTKKKIKLIDLIVTGAFLVLGFKSLKFIPLLYIVSTFTIFNFIDEFKWDISKSTFFIIMFAILLSYVIITPKLLGNYKSKLIPNEIIEHIKEKKPERLFNYYGYGGYLIYNDIPVFIDGRADMYSKYNLKDAVDIESEGYGYLINAYNFDMIVIPTNIPLNIHLSNNQGYEITKQNGNIVIYEKVISTVENNKK
jgi:hypothetical protein